FFPSLFFHSTPTSDIYTLSLHDALPIYLATNRQRLVAILSAALLALAVAGSGGHFRHRAESGSRLAFSGNQLAFRCSYFQQVQPDRKSTRLNSSHVSISYAVFCLKKKKK